MATTDTAREVAEARRAVHESLTGLSAWGADDVRAKVKLLEQAIERHLSPDQGLISALTALLPTGPRMTQGRPGAMAYARGEWDAWEQVAAVLGVQLPLHPRLRPSASSPLVEARNQARRQAVAALHAWGADGDKRAAGDEASPFYMWEDADRAAELIEGMIE